MSKPSNPPAFPVPPCPIKEEGHSCSYDDERGITARDYFAIRASEKDINEYRGSKPHGRLANYNIPEFTREEARYMFADAMLAEREKEV